MPLLRFLLCLVLLLTSAPTAEARVEAFFSDDVLTEELLIGELTQAQASVDVIVPSLADDALVRALRSVAGSGKAVRVLVSARREEGMKDWLCLPCIALTADGADMRYVDGDVRDFFIVIDGPRGRHASGDDATLIVATGRLAKAGDASLVRFTHEGDYALSYQTEFNRIWTKATDFQARPRHPANGTLRTPGAPAVLFDELGYQASAFVAGAIDHAYGSVDVAARALRQGDVFNALLKATARGVRVRLLVEGREQDGAPTPETCHDVTGLIESHLFDECLALAKGEVRYLFTRSGRSATVQSTYLVIDGKAVLAGDFSLKAAGGDAPFANVAVLRGPVAAQYERQFERLFQRAAGGRQPKA